MGSRAACGVEGVGRRFSDMPPAVELIWGLGLKIQGGISLEAQVTAPEGSVGRDVGKKNSM